MPQTEKDQKPISISQSYIMIIQTNTLFIIIQDQRKINIWWLSWKGMHIQPSNACFEHQSLHCSFWNVAKDRVFWSFCHEQGTLKSRTRAILKEITSGLLSWAWQSRFSDSFSKEKKEIIWCIWVFVEGREFTSVLTRQGKNSLCHGFCDEIILCFC